MLVHPLGTNFLILNLKALKDPDIFISVVTQSNISRPI